MKTEALTPHAVLKGEQRDASDPALDIWLSASAGTGKTYVLSARVLRLLLRGARPDSILCLTFTKAGAAEMAERVHRRLAHWVRLPATELASELRALDEDFGPECVAKARTLFASVLESRGGGLRIMTIHAFCQTLLAGFPLEAGLIPGFRPIEGREEAALAQNVLADLVVTAEREGDARLIEDLRALSRRLGEDDARRFLTRAARAVDALDALPDGIEPAIRRALDVPAEFDPGDICAACADGEFDRETLLDLARMHADWGTRTGEAANDAIGEWLLGTPEQRAGDLETLALVWNTRDGSRRKGGPKDAGYPEAVERLAVWCDELCALARRSELARAIASALNAGRRYARAYADAKRTRGLVDFDDLIAKARDLLVVPGMGDWIRYKLDQATDHILVDEAQDTNSDQWAIVAGLASEFWAGEGAKGDRLRTLFTVGDFKQAIFGFQGTNPLEYRGARGKFSAQAEDAGREIVQLSLNRSFRSTPPVLDVVDALLEELGAERLGIDDRIPAHVSASGGPGSVTLLAPLTSESDAEESDEESWLPSATRKLAGELARQVKVWLDEPMWLASKGRALRPEDVMILVRKRGDLAALLVGRLHAEGVKVAGVDRLRLKAPLAVRDLLAAMRFAAQPEDDLNLGALLVSPLIGWSQQKLFDESFERKGSLWEAIDGPTRDTLIEILNAADRVTPFVFLEQLLSGPLQARKKLLVRLGEEARDPIDELLNAALLFEREGTPSLQLFLDWFDRGDAEVVRDAAGDGSAVRVMTVHGAKGLQAPLVILADAASDPDKGVDRDFKWMIDDLVKPVPLFRPRSAERALAASLERAATEADEIGRNEHWRLLYVAMTRAEERLVVAGSRGPGARGVIPAESWHAAVERALARLGTEKIADPVWGARREYSSSLRASASPREQKEDGFTRRRGDAEEELSPAGRPEWLDRAAPVEARPPRPLAPSSMGTDTVANPPPGAAMAKAAERGRLLHGLFERLPAVAADAREAAGLRWLEGAGGVADAVERQALLDAAMKVIGDPAYSRMFDANALAEAPIAGVVDGQVIAGTVDRLAITDAGVEVVDFKTGRRVPATLDAIPEHHVRQMAAYAAVLAGIFPERAVTASLLYTEGPVLHRLTPALLAAHKPGFAGAQDNLPAGG